jgi:hypothetical protein
MRHVLALFDAPIPAVSAVRALGAAGFAPADLWLAAEAALPGSSDLARTDLPAETTALATELESRGLDRDDAALCAEGVTRRGAILVLVRCPSAAAPVAERILAAAAPPDLAMHRMRWQSQPGARHMWAHIEPPRTS